MMPKLRFTPLLAALALAGCSFMPAYERPAAPVPPAWPDSATPVEAAASAAQPLPDWHGYFADARLQRLIAIALDNNRDLRMAALNVEQVRAQYQIRAADLVPTIGVAASASRAPSAATGQYANSFSVGLALASWEIDFFGRIASLKEQALAQYLASAEGRNAAQASLVAAVTSTWHTLQADEELLDISRRTLGTREESVKLAQLRFESGAASELDFQQAQSLTAAARATLAAQQRQRALDENALALLLGQPLPADLRASLQSAQRAEGPALQSVPAGLPSDMLQRRPDIRQAEQQLRAANANIGAARAAFFPRIALTAQAGTVSHSLSGLFENGSWMFSVAPSLLLPIFDAGRNQAQLDAARVGRDLAVAQYEKTIQNAFREVADALASDTLLAEQARAIQAQLDAERTRFKLSDMRYQGGVASYLDLLDAQRSLFALEQAAVQVRLAQQHNRVALYKALGGGWAAHSADPAATAARVMPASSAQI